MTIKFRDALELVDRAANLRVVQHDATEGGRWTLYNRVFQIGGASVAMWLLHLHAGISRKDDLDSGIAALRRALQGGGAGQVIYADSLVDERRFPSVADGLGLAPIQVISESRFFSTFLSQQLTAYTQGVERLDVADFIEPAIEVQGSNHSWQEIETGKLMDVSRRAHRRPAVHILLAEPGQGKTHFSKYCAHIAIKANRIPLLVSSFQWENVSQTVLDSPWTTILHVFRHYGAPIPWADGVEELFVRVAQGTGLFQLIFDGLDEFVLRSSADISVRATLSQFFNLAQDSESQIVVTARTEFWNAEVADEFRYLTSKRTDVETCLYRQKPFGSRDAVLYFLRRYQVDADPQHRRTALSPATGAENAAPAEYPLKVRQAGALFDRLQVISRGHRNGTGLAGDLVGRGFFLYNIWALIDGTSDGNGHESSALELPDRDAFEWIVRNLCERENQRLRLNLNSSRQMKLFEHLAELTSDVRAQATTEQLTIFAEVELGLPASLVRQLLGSDDGRPGRLSRHPLVRQRADKLWEFVQTNVLYFFLSNRVLDVWRTGNMAELGKLLGRLNDLKYLVFELSSSLVERLLSQGFAIPTFGNLCPILVRAERGEIRNGEAMKSAIGCCVAVIATKHFEPGATNKAERTRLLASLVGSSGVLDSLSMVDSLAGFDFRNTHFRNCQFDNVQFTHCVFDRTTKFENCRFSGTSVKSSPGLDVAEYAGDCRLDAVLAKLTARNRGPRPVGQYDEEALEQDVRSIFELLSGFPRHGRPGIMEEIRATGVVNQSPMVEVLVILVRDRLFLKNNGIASDPIWRLSDNAVRSLAFLQSNGTFTGILSKLWQELKLARQGRFK